MIWELIGEAIEGNRTRYSNRVTCHPTGAFMAFIEQHGQSFEDAAAARQSACGDHNRRENGLSPKASPASPAPALQANRTDDQPGGKVDTIHFAVDASFRATAAFNDKIE